MKIHGLKINQIKSPFAEYFKKDLAIKVKKYQRRIPINLFYTGQ